VIVGGERFQVGATVGIAQMEDLVLVDGGRKLAGCPQPRRGKG